MNKKLWIIIGSAVTALAVILVILFAFILPNTLFKNNDKSKDKDDKDTKPSVSDSSENNDDSSKDDTSSEGDTFNPDSMTFYAGSVEGTAGKYVSVPVKVAKNEGFMASLFDIRYDSKVLKYIGYDPGDVISDYQFNEADGCLTFLHAENEDVKNDGTLFTLRFEVIGKAGDTSDIIIDFSSDVSDVVNYEEESVPCKAKNGTVTVK